MAALVVPCGCEDKGILLCTGPDPILLQPSWQTYDWSLQPASSKRPCGHRTIRAAARVATSDQLGYEEPMAALGSVEGMKRPPLVSSPHTQVGMPAVPMVTAVSTLPLLWMFAAE